MTQIEQVGCFRIGSKITIGNGKKVRTITGFYHTESGTTWATFDTRDRTSARVKDISLAGAV